MPEHDDGLVSNPLAVLPIHRNHHSHWAFGWAGVSANMLRRSYRRQQQIEDQLRAASGAFMELMEDRFSEWGLTSAEREVALFSVKGMSAQEISALRDLSEGTVKAQTNAIYRKAGVSGRSQILSLFIDDLVEIPTS